MMRKESPNLTPIERDVLKLSMLDKSMADIGIILSISPEDALFHYCEARLKLGLVPPVPRY